MVARRLHVSWIICPPWLSDRLIDLNRHLTQSTPPLGGCVFVRLRQPWPALTSCFPRACRPEIGKGNKVRVHRWSPGVIRHQSARAVTGRLSKEGSWCRCLIPYDFRLNKADKMSSVIQCALIPSFELCQKHKYRNPANIDGRLRQAHRT